MLVKISHRSLLILAAIACASVLLCFPDVAMGQAESPPTPSLRQSPPKWLGFLVMIVLVLPILFLSLMPSKRSHQD